MPLKVNRHVSHVAGEHIGKYPIQTPNDCETAAGLNVLPESLPQVSNDDTSVR
jgi:hypothetical protein